MDDNFPTVADNIRPSVNPLLSNPILPYIETHDHKTWAELHTMTEKYRWEWLSMRGGQQASS